MPRSRACYFAMEVCSLCTLLAAGLNCVSPLQRLLRVGGGLKHSTNPQMLASMAFLGPGFYSRCQASSARAEPAVTRPSRRVTLLGTSPRRITHVLAVPRGHLGFCARAWQISEDSIATSAQQRELNLRVAEAPEALVTSGVASRQAVRHQSASKGRSAAAALWHRKSAAAGHPLALWPADARR